MTLTVAFCLALAAVLPPVPADSSATAPRQVRAVRFAQPPAIDGYLTEPLWQSAERVSGFLQRDPTEGAAASESTVVYIAYDDAALYIGARLYDSRPDSIVGVLARRDQGFNADRFTMYIDPYYDRRSGYYFGINASGTLFDGTLYNDDWNDASWDGVWEGKVSRDSLGWTVEMRIPYSQLRFVKRSNYVWGINFKRDLMRKQEFSYLVYTPKNSSGFVSRFVDLVGIEEIVPPRRLEVMPYVTSRASFTNPAPGNPFNDGSELSPGFGADARIGLGSNLTLNATVNPDFGQVEVDPAVVNLSDVETFFNEKRPFFVEGSSIFNFGFGGQRNFWGYNWPGPTFFYSRRIGRALGVPTPPDGYGDGPEGTHILGALKLTGKVAGSWNVGGLTAVTARERATLEDSLGTQWSQEIEPLAVYGVYRVQNEFAKGRQGLGFLATVVGRDFDDQALRDSRNSSAAMLGMDGWTFLDSSKTWVTTAWVAGSRVAGTPARITAVQRHPIHYFQQPDAKHVSVDPTATSLSGWAARFTLAKQGGRTFVNSALGFLSPSFDNHDVGFMSRTGLINFHAGAGRTWTTPGKVFRYAEAGGTFFRTYDWDGNINWNGVHTFGYAQFLNYYWINWNMAYNPWTVSNRRTRGGPLTLTPPGYELNFNAGTDNRKKWILSSYAGTYYRNGNNYDGWGGFDVEFRPAPNLSLSIGPSWSWVNNPTQYVTDSADAAAVTTYGRAYVFARLRQTEFSSGIRVNWTYSPTLSLQLYAQPLISAGKYDEFKQLAQSRSDDYTPTTAPSNPDFNFKSLRGNAVLRWEYMPGSTIYLVWTQTRSDFDPTGDFRFGSSMRQLWQAPADNIFMIKATYWWNP